MKPHSLADTRSVHMTSPLLTRIDGRTSDESRPITLTPHFISHHRGSCLIAVGNTKVICTAILENGVPHFLTGKKEGWLTSEYGMLPGSSSSRIIRESAKGKVTGRTHEIQRLIGRSLRTVMDLKLIGERTVWIDCDVIQADGGTRTAAITGSCVAVGLLIQDLLNRKLIEKNPLKQCVAATSLGIVKGELLLDLNYPEDSACDVDMNVVMSEDGGFIEVQGTAEKKPFQRSELDTMLSIAETGIRALIAEQKKIIGSLWP